MFSDRIEGCFPVGTLVDAWIVGEVTDWEEVLNVGDTVTVLEEAT